MTIATISLSIVYIFTKLLNESSRIQPYEITYCSGFSCFLSMFILMKYLESKTPRDQRGVMLSRDIFKVPKEARLPLILRGIFGFTSNIAGTIAMKLIPLAKATVLFYTNPIFIAILGWIILKEHITVFDMCGVAATFLGVVIFTINPFASNDVIEKEMSSNEKLIDIIGSLMALFGATQNAGAMLSIRKVGGRTHFMMLGLVWGLGNMLLSPLMMYMKPIRNHHDT
jgi:drug/metabolite transporter (DMT)-like permease